MATVLLFHHVLGRTNGLAGVAEVLRGRGHHVVVPDLFEGCRFASIDEGVAFVEELGFGKVVERGVTAAAGRGPMIVVGVSLGVLPAQRLAQTDERVAGAFLIDAASRLGEFSETWPSGVPVEIHMVDGDEFAAEDRDAADELVAVAADARLVVHDGDGHLVIDASAPAHDAAIAETVVAALVEFVDRHDDPAVAGVRCDEFGRPHPPLHGDEAATLFGFLDYQRATLAWKCSGLDADGLGVTVGASSMTLGGMLRHLAYVEDDWSHRWLHGEDRPDPWESVDWSTDPDWEWTSAASSSPEELRALWDRSVERSDRRLREALVAGGLDGAGKRSWPDGSAPSLRWILVHLIEEYARHNGHADLLREAADGATGE